MKKLSDAFPLSLRRYGLYDRGNWFSFGLVISYDIVDIDNFNVLYNDSLK